MRDENGEGGLEAAFGRGASAFRRRFSLGAFVAIVLLVGLGSLLAWRQYEDEKRKALNEMRARVVVTSTVFDTYFAGQLGALNAIARSPSVLQADTTAMQMYFARVQAGTPKPFTGGLGWIDRRGVSRVSTTRPGGPHLNVSDRSFFRAVVSTGKPFISEGLKTRIGERRVVVMAVPTRDPSGRLTGVLAGALQLRPSRTDQRAIDLGYEGLVVVDRAGQQVTRTSFAPPRNTTMLARMKRGEGVLSGVRGLDGSPDRVVAFANSKAAGWITAIERPRTAVFAAARRGLMLDLAAIGAAALIVLSIIGWAVVRSRRDQETERVQMRRWDELAQSLGDVSAAGEVSAVLGSALATAFPDAHVIVAVEDRRGLTISTFKPEHGVALNRRAAGVIEIARLAYDSGAAASITVADVEAVRDAVASVGDALTARVRSLYALPLLTRTGGSIGSLTLLLPNEEPLGEAEQALVAAHADHAARALTRARRFEQEHDVAVALQRSLLPEALPAIDGLDLAGRYNAGGVGLEVGGDWYDAVRRPDGILHLTVGDVAGRGIPAAVLMGQLRNAFRALAYEHSSPAAIARRLSRHVPDAGMATAVFLTLDPYTGELTYASAGHPPSLLLDIVTGAVTSLDQASAPPLGWAVNGAIKEARLTLPAQTALLAYTDGLVERRGTGIDEGIDLLRELLRETPQLTAQAASDMLLERVVAPLSATDDIALLFVQITDVPARMTLEIPADPSLLYGLRARLKVWLARRGLGDQQQADTVLAVTEACNNAIEHAYQRPDGTIKLALEHKSGKLQITIEDEGTWRAPKPDPTRGRGMMIMKGTMHKARVTAERTGTRVDLELRVPARRASSLIPRRERV